MSHFKLLSATTSPLTYEKAVEFRDMTPSPVERDLLPKRLQELKRRFDADLTVTFHWATAKIKDQDEIYRMNGQHTANILANMNGAFPEGLQMHLDHYEVEDMEGLALLFRQFDPRESGRSAGDVAGAYIGLEPALAGINKQTAKLAIEGIAWYNENIEGLPPVHGDDRYEMFHSPGHHPFLFFTNDLFGIKTPELKRHQIVGAMYGTWRANREEAEKFWERVAAGGVENDDDNPTNKLDAWLEAQKTAIGAQKAKPAQHFQACIFAWNAYRRGEKVKTIKSDTKHGFLPIVE